MDHNITLTEKKLIAEDCVKWVSTPDSGGTSIFIGTVRNHTRGRKVVRLEFEAYGNMAVKEMEKIALAAIERWKIKKIVIHHRTGTLHAGDIPVIIAVSAAHREAAIDACRYAIDTLKKKVPIWKKEIFEDGEVWVAAHP